MNFAFSPVLVRLCWLLLALITLSFTLLGILALLQIAEPTTWQRMIPALTAGLTAEAFRRSVRTVALPSSHGSAGFSPPPAAWRFPYHARKPGRVCLGHYGKAAIVLPRALTLRHGLVLGPTGAGKSFGFFLANVAAQIGCSLVCSDPKSELWRYTSGRHPHAQRFSPAEPDASAAFNWVPLCREAGMAERIARAIIESGNTGRTEQVWLDLEAGFLTALFAHAATLDEPTPLTAYYLLCRQPPETLLLQLEQSDSELAREQANLLRQTTERVRGSVIPVVAARLQFLRDPAVARFTSAVSTAPDFARLRHEPSALYWCLHEQDMARLRPLSAAFFTVLIEQLLTGRDTAGVGAGREQTTTTVEVPITLFLDEFAAIGTIPDFDTLIAVARGRGLAFWLGLQSLAQLEVRYGPAVARTILTNCCTKLILPGLDVDSAEYVSRSLGQETRRTIRHSHQAPFWSLLPRSRTVGDADHARSLLTADEVRRLPEREMLALVAHYRPFRLSRPDYNKAPITKNASILPPARVITTLKNPEPSFLFPKRVQGPANVPPWPPEESEE